MSTYKIVENENKFGVKTIDDNGDSAGVEYFETEAEAKAKLAELNGEEVSAVETPADAPVETPENVETAQQPAEEVTTPSTDADGTDAPTE